MAGWCSWLSHVVNTDKVLGFNPSLVNFFCTCLTLVHNVFLSSAEVIFINTVYETNWFGWPFLEVLLLEGYQGEITEPFLTFVSLQHAQRNRPRLSSRGKATFYSW
jgi:hypothetical protein